MTVPPNLRTIKVPDCCRICKHYELYDKCRKYNAVVSEFDLCDSYE